MKKWLIVLSVLASLLLGASVASAQDGVETSPFINLGDFHFGVGKANVALFVTPDKSSPDSIALGSVLDLAWLDLQIAEMEIDPAIGLAVYHNGGGETRFGPTLTIHADAPIQWLFENITGWVVSDETAERIGESTELRLGVTYAWEVNDFEFDDPEARFVLMAGIKLEF